MQLKSKIIELLYGKIIEYNNEDIIDVKSSIIGFDNLKKYIIVGDINEEFDFCFLQSIENENISFVVTDPFLFKKDYDFSINDDVKKALELSDIKDLKVFSIVNIKNELKESTMNLKAPIIVNFKTKKAVQFIVEEDYSIKQKIYN